MVKLNGFISESDLKELHNSFFISDESIKNRGYLSISRKDELYKYGNTEKVDSNSGFLVPCFSTRGVISGYKFYSSPGTMSFPIYFPANNGLSSVNSKLAQEDFIVDSPLASLNDFQNPQKHIYIANSPMMADSLSSRGLCTISVSSHSYNKYSNMKEYLDYLKYSFEPINWKNREARILRDYSSIYQDYPFQSSIPLIRTLQQLGGTVSIFSVPNKLKISKFGYKMDLLSNLSLVKLPELLTINEEPLPFNDELECKFIILTVMLRQSIDLFRRQKPSDYQKFQFSFAPDNLYEAICQLVGNDDEINIPQYFSVEFISYFLYSLGFSMISGLLNEPEEWICPYSKLISILEKYQIFIPYLKERF